MERSRLFPPAEVIPSVSKLTVTGGDSLFSSRREDSTSTTLRPKRLMLLVKIRSICPALAASIISRKPLRLPMEVPLTPSSLNIFTSSY